MKGENFEKRVGDKVEEKLAKIKEEENNVESRKLNVIVSGMPESDVTTRKARSQQIKVN